MTEQKKEVLFRWLKKKSITDWLEISAIEGDTWELWVKTSIEELTNNGKDALILFGPEVLYIMEHHKIFEPDKIFDILIEFYNEELNKIKNGSE